MDGKRKAELDDITARLVEKINDQTARWSALYGMIEEVEGQRLWEDGGFKSFTKWFEDLARRAKCNIQYLWRVKKAGSFYARYAEAERAAGRDAAPVSEVTLGDEMLADIDRISDGDPEKAHEYIAAALGGKLSKAKLRSMVKATAGARRKARAAKSGDTDAAVHGGEDGCTAADIIIALRPEVLHPGASGRYLMRGVRRVWQVFGELPVRTGTSDHARRIDALCVSNAGDDSQYDVALDMVEVKVTFDDLARDTKHLEYEPFVDRCWFAVPESMSHAAEEAAPDGWGVLVWSPVTRALRVVRNAEVRRGAMRAEVLATALVKALPVVQRDEN